MYQYLDIAGIRSCAAIVFRAGRFPIDCPPQLPDLPQITFFVSSLKSHLDYYVFFLLRIFT